MRFVLTCLIALLLATPALAQEEFSLTPPPGNIYDVQPFSNGAHFSSVNCGQTFDCNAYALPEQLMELANQCATQRLGFPENMMVYFESTGDYENCALPDNYVSKDTGSGTTAFWPICCIGPSGDQCQFICHYYTGTGG